MLGQVNTNLGPGPLNTNSEPGLLNTNWRPGPVDTNLGPGLINANWGRGLGARVGGSWPGAGTKQRAEGREIQIPVLHHGIKNIERQYLFVSSI